MKQSSLIKNVLLGVWPAVCRHVEIEEATANAGQVLTEHLPVRGVIVRRVNLAAGSLETVAVGAGKAGSGWDRRTKCSPEQMKDLLAWGARGEVAVVEKGRHPQEISSALPHGVGAGAVVGPLTDGEDLAGVLIVVPRTRQTFDAAEQAALAGLLEPFSVALENDRRVHELAQLREAAEADRRALLAKLGRSDVAAPIVGAEGGLRPVMDRVSTVAASDVPVLLFGETGTGKEVVARAIHMHSRRVNGPFLRVNCGAIPSELIDSQLFGHEKGSFTGATDTRKGWFGRADGGTLFLDEIGDLPMAAQVRLLRVLQDGTLERVGGERVIHVDVRVVGATHRDLAAMVREGQFREDLWYRLAVFPIAIPPLRERPEDVESLARYFAEKAATRFGLPVVLPTVGDVDLLAGYAWPGNVRELAAVIDRAALLGNGRRLEIATALGAAPSVAATGERVATAAASEAARGRGALVADGAASEGDSLEDAMRRHIEAALHACRGRVEGPYGAAVRLGINPNTLRSRMRRLRINWKTYRGGA